MADAVTPATGSGQVNYVGSSSNKKSSGVKVDSEMFLKLLVAQVQYQDPLEPQSNTQLVTELAQMSSMEQMQQMNLSLTNSQAYDLIGKYAYAEVLDSETGVTNSFFGKITGIMINSGITYAVIGESAIDVSDISQVYDSSAIETTEDTAAQETKTTDTTGDTGTDTPASSGDTADSGNTTDTGDAGSKTDNTVVA